VARLADDPRVSANLRDIFPSPYTLADADAWLARAGEIDLGAFAIEAGGVLVGGCGAHRRGDVHRYTAEVGYWLGVEHWGRGIATEALTKLTAWCFESTDVQRLEACVFDWNPASGRVLEKAGYTFEGMQRRAVYKRGRFGDLAIWAKLR
jgi:RimJ/RimL family protein N-acetyltransferase